MTGSTLTLVDVPRLSSPETVLSLLSASSKCEENLAAASFDDAYTVDMVGRTQSSYNSRDKILTVKAYPDPTPVLTSRRVLIPFKINSGAIIDYAGNSITFLGSLAVAYRPPELQPAFDQAPEELQPPLPKPPPVPSLVKPMNDTKVAEEAGKATSAMVVVTTVSTLGGSVVAAAASSGKKIHSKNYIIEKVTSQAALFQSFMIFTSQSMKLSDHR